MEGYQILDGIILYDELIHSLKLTKIPGLLIKLDLSKVFDKFKWSYMEKILQAFGFDPV